MGTSSGPSGETRVTWNDDMAPRWNNLLNFGLNQGFDIHEDGSVHAKPRAQYGVTTGGAGTYDRMNDAQLQQYGFSNPNGTGNLADPTGRIAPLSGLQNEAIGYITEMNRQSTSPTDAMNAARSQIEGTLGGKYLGDYGSNPNANMFAGLNVPAMNPYIGGNQYKGEGPAFNAMLQDTLGDITNAYKQGTSADTTRLFNLSGAFGGSAHQNAVANNEAALGKTLSQTANQMRSDQFNRSAGLQENEINRGFQNFTGGIDRGFNAYENERGRQMQGIGYGQNEQGLAFERGNQLMNAGTMQRDYLQSLFGQDYSDWADNQNTPWQAINQLAGLYSQSLGGGGMNQLTYGDSSSRAAPWLGAALAGASLFR